MGGPGSGSHYHWWRPPKRTTVEECLSLDANRWMREGILKTGHCHAGFQRWTYASGAGFTVDLEVDTQDLVDPWMRLRYSWVWHSTGQKDSADYQVRLTTSRPHFGGLRWWFRCPMRKDGISCGKRVGKLYLHPRGRCFGCRLCYDLTFTSCQESHRFDGIFRQIASNNGWDLASVKRAMRGIGRHCM
jgi:hypothetical protein